MQYYSTMKTTKYSRTLEKRVIWLVSNMISLDQVKLLEAAGFTVVMIVK
jgi:hypothetical protein